MKPPVPLSSGNVNAMATGKERFMSFYVYFDRNPQAFGESTVGKAMAAKMKLELCYEAAEGVLAKRVCGLVFSFWVVKVAGNAPEMSSIH